MPNLPSIYILVSENLSHLGGQMGTEYTTTNYTKYFSKYKFAMDYAEKDYGKSIIWIGDRKGKGGVDSGDLGHVKYYISKLEVEA